MRTLLVVDDLFGSLLEPFVRRMKEDMARVARDARNLLLRTVENHFNLEEMKEVWGAERKHVEDVIRCRAKLVVVTACLISKTPCNAWTRSLLNAGANRTNDVVRRWHG